jgi:hypothetical protein
MEIHQAYLDVGVVNFVAIHSLVMRLVLHDYDKKKKQ